MSDAGTSTGTWAVVVNWNGGDDNLACIASLVAEGIAPERIAFVDNASSDGSAEAVARAHPGLVVLENDRNLGFGHGANRGIEAALAAGAERVLLLNNDATLGEGALALLEAELAGDATLGAVGPRILYKAEPERIWCAGGTLTWRQNLSTLIGFREPDGERFRRSFDVDYVAGCALLAPRAAFERVGALDGAYFAYHEDLEFGVRLRAAGLRSRIVGAAAAYHDAHGSTGGGYNPRRKYMMGVNTIWFLRQHGRAVHWLSFLLFDVATLPAAWLVHALRGEGAAVAAKARGMWDGWRGRRVTEESLGRL